MNQLQSTMNTWPHQGRSQGRVPSPKTHLCYPSGPTVVGPLHTKLLPFINGRSVFLPYFQSGIFGLVTLSKWPSLCSQGPCGILLWPARLTHLISPEPPTQPPAPTFKIKFQILCNVWNSNFLQAQNSAPVTGFLHALFARLTHRPPQPPPQPSKSSSNSVQRMKL